MSCSACLRASTDTCLHMAVQCTPTSSQFPTLLLRTQLSRMASALSDLSFPALLSAFPWQALGKAHRTPVPTARPRPPWKLGKRPWGARQPCEEGGPVSCKLCHEAAWSSPARERHGPSLAVFPSTPTPSQKLLPEWKSHSPPDGGEAAVEARSPP